MLIEQRKIIWPLLSQPRTAVNRIWQTLFRLIPASCALILIGAPAIAQSGNDLGIPAQSKPGQSTTSTYARDKIETVNLANQNLSLRIPLVSIGGRGSASYVIALAYNSKVWSSHNEQEPGNPTPIDPYFPFDHWSGTYDDTYQGQPGPNSGGSGWKLTLGPSLKMQKVEIEPIPQEDCHQADCGHRYVLTRIWLVLADGSEIELRDNLTDGAPAATPVDGFGLHTSIDRDRGRVWHSTDGSNIVYIADSSSALMNHHLDGWVFYPDGTRLRMNSLDGWCSQIMDRNGNFITFDSNGFTDELGRVVTVTGTETSFTVTAKGYNGVPDRVFTADLGMIGALDGSGVPGNLRSDFRSLQRPFYSGDYLRTRGQSDQQHTDPNPHTDLFEGSENADPIDQHLALMALHLPDGRSFRFRYNQYGEVAEIVYPGGGISQIDYAGASAGGNSPALLRKALNRWVVQRRSLTDGVNVDAVTLYSRGGATVGGVAYPTVTVESRQGSVSGTLLASETHYFLAVDSNYYSGYERWQNAKEFQVDRQTGSGTITVKYTWMQRAAVVWANDAGSSQNLYVLLRGQEQPPNDPRVTVEDTILENGKMKRVTYEYDNFNNVVAQNEYDFGETNGSVGTLLRQTLRTYATDINGICYSNLNPADSSCGSGLASDVSSIIYQRHLLLNETIKDADYHQRAYSDVEYDDYSGASNHAPVVPNSGMIKYDGSRFSSFSSSSQPRGNVTKASRWAGGSNYIYAFSQYDNAGNVVWTKDPNGNITTVSYADNFGDGSNPDAGAAGTNGSTYAMATLATNALGQQAKSQYHYTYGAPTGSKDPNGVIAKTEYDNMGRPFRSTVALGLPEQAISEMSYPTASANEARASGQLDATRWLSSRTQFDGFDRPVLTSAAEDGQHYDNASYTIFSQTVYDALGRVHQTSNPYRQSVQPVYTTMAYDLAGRVTSVTTPGNGVVTTSYDGETVTVTDQALRKRRSVTDGLGRLIRVDEPDKITGALDNDGSPVQSTNYTYDVLGNLKRVDQGEEQHRYFLYDSLSRLIRARNPEQETNALNTLNDPFPDPNYLNSEWSFKYVYDDNGNLRQRTDPRGVISSYGYDALNRNTSVTYASDPANTPAITRLYDNTASGANGKGRLWKTQTAGAMGSLNTIDTYDALGRLRKQRQQFYSGGHWSQDYTVERTYDRAGHVLKQTYPSGHTVDYSYDQAGRTSTFTGNLGDGEQHTYASDFMYTESGAIQQEKFGTLTPLYHKQQFNARGQLWDMRLSTLSFNAAPGDGDRGAIVNYYSNNFVQGGTGADNNGSLLRQEISIPGSSFYRESYSYDHLNRLTSVREKVNGTGNDTFKQGYTFDRWGNRTIDQANTTSNVPHPGFTANVANNRLIAPAGTGPLGYDEAGNLTQDSTNPNLADALYDAENRLKQVSTAPTCYLNGEGEPICNPGSSLTSGYVYDGEGQRVRRIRGSVLVPYQTWQVYGMDGELLAEYENGPAAYIFIPQKEYGYRSGQLLITASSGDEQRVERFITNFYYAALGRAPSAEELSQKRTALVQAAAQGQTQLVTAAITLGQTLFDLGNANSEYNQRQRSDTQFVTDLYFAYLQRPPEGGGLAYYVGQLQQQLASRTMVRDGFGSSTDMEFVALASTIYGTNNGNLPDRVARYLSNMYLGAIGNEGSFGDDLATLEAAAAEGQSQVIEASRTIGVNLFAQLARDERTSSDEDFVAALFHSFLQREPSESDLSLWIEKTQNGGRETILTMFSELPATQELAGTLYREILWLTPDHLGTPRMISERSGSLAGIKRHDYLPFGEEVPANFRNGIAGYAASDSVRQKFTQKERDNETSLDYFEARYYSSTQGRFTSADNLVGRLTNPQTLNLYSYVKNNPLKYVDPSGHQDELPKKKGKKGNDDDEFLNTPDTPEVIITVTNAPRPAPSSFSPPQRLLTYLFGVQFYTREEMEIERLQYAKQGPVSGGIYDFLSQPETPLLLMIPFTAPGVDPYAAPESLGTVMLEESDVSVGRLLMPGGNLIGKAGSSSTTRVLQGGVSEAQALFDKLAAGGKVVTNSTYKGTLVDLPNGGTVGIRTIMTRSPGTAATIDVQVRGIPATKIKFNPN
jgi:RHS repeat-associated protein